MRIPLSLLQDTLIANHLHCSNHWAPSREFEASNIESDLLSLHPLRCWPLRVEEQCTGPNNNHQAQQADTIPALLRSYVGHGE
jgi:hypothetical protein